MDTPRLPESHQPHDEEIGAPDTFDTGSLQSLYSQMNAEGQVISGHNLAFPQENGPDTVIETASIAPYDNGNQRFVLRVALDETTYRVHWAGEGQPPDIYKRVEGSYAKTNEEEAEMVRGVTLMAAQTLLHS